MTIDTGKLPQIIPDLPNGEYHSAIGLSASNLKGLLSSYETYEYDRQNADNPSPAMSIGSAIHELFLGGEKAFQDNVAIFQDAKTRAGNAWEVFRNNNPGKIIILEKEIETVNRAVTALHLNPIAGLLIEGENIKKEYSYFCREPLTGEQEIVKARPDIYDPETASIIDLKTFSGTVDPNSAEFMWSARKYLYHLQVAFYGDVIYWTTGKRIENYLIIAVETTEPFGVAIYEFDKGEPVNEKPTIAEGRMLYEKALKNYTDYQVKKSYKGYEAKTHNLKFSRKYQ